jgi:hypothetical protein
MAQDTNIPNHSFQFSNFVIFNITFDIVFYPNNYDILFLGG